jgi:hypothetical protein
MAAAEELRERCNKASGERSRFSAGFEPVDLGAPGCFYELAVMACSTGSVN